MCTEQSVKGENGKWGLSHHTEADLQDGNVQALKTAVQNTARSGWQVTKLRA